MINHPCPNFNEVSWNQVMLSPRWIITSQRKQWMWCRVWSWSSMPCEKHGPRDSVDKNRGRRPKFLYPRPTKLEGGYTGFTLSVCPSVCPSVCRRHGFRSISQVCFGISISNFICMLMVAIGRSLLIFSDVIFKMAAWWPYWIFWFPDSNFTLALNINFKLQRHNTYVYG